MKHKFMLILMCVLLNIACIHANALDFQMDDVSSVEFRCGQGGGVPRVPDERYSRQHFRYQTDDKREMQYIGYYLNAMTFVDDGKNVGIGHDVYIVTLLLNREDNTTDTVYFVDDRAYTSDEKQYEVEVGGYSRLGEFVYALKKEKISLPEMIFQPSAWADDSIKEASSLGILPKWNRFNYSYSIDRLEVCQIVDAMLKVSGLERKVTDEPLVLEDTDDIAVEHLYLDGIIEGKSSTEFCPYDMITREEFARVLANSYSVISTDKPSAKSGASEYADTAQISDWAKDDVETVSDLGLMQGDEKGCFNPQEHITKEEVIVTLLRLYEQVQ